LVATDFGFKLQIVCAVRKIEQERNSTYQDPFDIDETQHGPSYVRFLQYLNRVVRAG
jgi:hypothetical protein